MKKIERQTVIEQIIQQNIIATQDELIKYLDTAGIQITQATLSRDIKELKLVKQNDAAGHYRYMIVSLDNQVEIQHLYEVIYKFVVSITKIEFVNVIKTLPSYANMVGALIDDLNLPMVTATLAGHDTIVVFSQNDEIANEFNQLVSEHTDPELIKES